MRLVLVFLLSVVATPALPSEKDAVADCLRRLSRGENRFGARLDARALAQGARGLARHAAKLRTRDAFLLVDYSMNSRAKRAFLVDLKACDVLAREHVIHGGAVYRPVLEMDGDPDHDGMLDRCLNRRGTTKNMTRPGFMVTSGCHVTGLSGWPRFANGCHGVKLKGLEERNRDVLASGVVLHEHQAIPDDGRIKPVGQGCPAFPPGRLEPLLRFGLQDGFLVYVHAPQCEG